MTITRLQKFLAECGLGSRRQCEEIIAQDRVRVNDAPGTLGQAVDPGRDTITVDGRPVERGALVYLLLHKPKDTISSTRDDNDRETVQDLLADLPPRVFPLGRPEMDMEGAILLTNDGDLVHRLMEPAHPLDRVYIATVRGVVSETTGARIGSGVLLEDGATVRARVRVLHTGVDSSVLRIAIEEGPRARVRHLMAVLGHPVLELRRIVEAGLELGALEPGQWRELTGDEVERLRNAAGLTATR